MSKGNKFLSCIVSIRKFFFDSKYSKLLLLLPLILYLRMLPDFFLKEKVIFPSPAYVYTVFEDISDNGNSEVVGFTNTAGELVLDYILRSGFPFPYVGIRIRDHINSFSAAGFDTLKLRIKSKPSVSHSIQLLCWLPEKRRDNVGGIDLHTVSYHSHTVQGSDEYTSYEIPLSKFDIPAWWIAKTGINGDNFGSLNKRAIASIEILASSLKGHDTLSSFSIEYIALEKNILRSFYLTSLIVAALYAIIILINWFLSSQKTVKTAKETIRIRTSLDLDNEKELAAHHLLEYISKHYNDPDLSVNELAAKLSMSVYAIPNIINRYTNLSFRQYINTLRIDEAKKQLVTTDNKIIDIAYAVGYNTIAHFNKIFKKHEGISPKEFRSKSQ